MLWRETTSRILLILFIVNFALAAPVVVRDIHETRNDPWAQWSTTNPVPADRTSAPPSPVGNPEYPEHGLAQFPPASPATSSVASNSQPASPLRPMAPTTPDNAPWNPESPSGPHGGWASPESYGAQYPHGEQSWDSEWDSNRMTLPPQWLVDDSNNPSISGNGPPPTQHPPPLSPQQSSSHLDPSWNSVWDSDRMTLPQQWLVDDPDYPPTPKEELTVNGPPARNSPPSSPPQSTATGPPLSTDGRPPPSPGPDVNLPPSPESHESESFLESLLKGRIRRHISSPVAEYSTRRELQGTIDSTTDLAKRMDSLATSSTSGVVGRGAGIPLRGLQYRRQSRRKV